MSRPGAEADEQGDPSMEDILASIRRILNDGETDAVAPAGQDADPTRLGQSSSGGEEEVFLLDPTMLVKEPPRMEHEDKMAEAEPTPDAVTKADDEAYAGRAAAAEPEPLLAPSTTAAASASLGALVRVVSQRQTAVYRGGPTIEDVVREEIRPIVKEWLDENLAPMVERMVRAEIERVTRGG
jgi:cell pole-organizing protein PopZ